MRVLLIEDEPLLGDAVARHLGDDGHAVDWMQRLDDADAALRAVDYGLVLLDLHLPDGRGLDLLKAMRGRADKRPVIILTARDQVSDRIRGLDAGADDYLVKPFDLDELRARVRAVARRYAGEPSPTLTVGDVVVDLAAHRVARDGVPVALTAREWALVACLAQRRTAVLGKDALEEALYAFGAEIESNAVEVYVSRLRKKLGRGFVETLRGVGYRLGGR